MIKPYYEHAGITIYHGDCREVLPELDRADLCLVDPPYGLGENAYRVAKRGKLAKTTDYGSFDWDKKPADNDSIQACIASGKVCIIWGGNYFHLPPSRGWLVWDKKNSGNFAECELAWTNAKTSVRIFRFMWNGMLRDGESRRKKRVHPAQKPVELMQWCISFAPDCETIVDPFAGSCTTAVAAKNLGVKCICIEKSEAYCEAGARRLQQEVLPL